MIVLGADMHKGSHTVAAVDAGTGRCSATRRSRSVSAGSRGAGDWARGLGAERVWALEDCRHVSGALERFLDRSRRARGPCRDAADGRRAARRPRARQVGSDQRDRGRARSTARRHRRGCRSRSWPASSSTSGCWSTTGSAWFGIRVGDQQRPALAPARPLARARRCPGGALFSKKWNNTRSAGAWRAPSRPRASGSPATSCVACASSPSPSTRSRPRSQTSSPKSRRSCSTEPGFGPLTAGQADRRDRRRHSASAATPSSPAPPASRRSRPAPARTNRHRLDRGGNRQINAAMHRVAVTRARCHPETERLHRPQTSRRQDHPRSHPLPQTPPRPPHLAPPPAAPPARETPPSPSIS